MDGHDTAVLNTEAEGASRFWPSPQDYNEALQNPETAFNDPELRACIPEFDKLGLPRPTSGAFASVYKVRSGDNKAIAVRCFLRNTRDQELRYELISNFVMTDDLPCTVSFEYQKKGVLIQGEWFPILKMEWVEGVTLEQFIHDNLNDREALVRLLDRFKALCNDLSRAGIAHGDLQHGNIMVTTNGDIRLVDYDGMFVPSMACWKSNELGHRNFQHPKRDSTHFGPFLDTFASWSIFVSLVALIEDPSLYAKCKGGSDCLLLRREDYESWFVSPAVKNLVERPPSELTRSVGCLLWLLQSEPDERLPLGTALSTEMVALVKRRFEQLSVTKVSQDLHAGTSRWYESVKYIPRVTDPADEVLFGCRLRRVEQRPGVAVNRRRLLILLAISLFLLLIVNGLPVFMFALLPIAILTFFGDRSSSLDPDPINSPFCKTLVARGVACEGLVIEKGYSERNSPKVRYWYRIPQPDGTTYDRVDELIVTQSELDSIQVGDLLTILHADPDRSIPGQTRSVSIPYRYSPYRIRSPRRWFGRRP